MSNDHFLRAQIKNSPQLRFEGKMSFCLCEHVMNLPFNLKNHPCSCDSKVHSMVNARRSMLYAMCSLLDALFSMLYTLQYMLTTWYSMLEEEMRKNQNKKKLKKQEKGKKEPIKNEKKNGRRIKIYLELKW